MVDPAPEQTDTPTTLPCAAADGEADQEAADMHPLVTTNQPTQQGDNTK
jgi:hypothetical protein